MTGHIFYRLHLRGETIIVISSPFTKARRMVNVLLSLIRRRHPAGTVGLVAGSVLLFRRTGAWRPLSRMEKTGWNLSSNFGMNWQRPRFRKRNLNFGITVE